MNSNITLEEFQKNVLSTDQTSDVVSGKDIILPFGLMGEIGSIASSIKKHLRDQKGSLDRTRLGEYLLEELGDALWYTITLSSKNSIKVYGPQVKVENNFSMDLLGGFVYDLVTEMTAFVNQIRKGDSLTSSDRPQKIIELIAKIAAQFNYSLSDVIENNINKTKRRWGSEEERENNKEAPYYDKKFICEEQIPRQAEIYFTEKKKGEKKIVYMRMNGINIGDPITDNSLTPDEYRYHDVFHWSYLAVLGWSPVLRSLLKCKRKSDSKKDEVQDGARATIVEEAISFQIFDYARDRKFLEGLKKVDHDLLKLIKNLTRGLEVDSCAEWEWEKAILDGYKAFRFFKQNSGGILRVDADTRSIQATIE